MLLEQRALPQRRFGERLGRRLPVLREQPLVEGPGIDPDPDRDLSVSRRASYFPYFVVKSLDVAGVDANSGATRIDRREDIFGLEMDIGDNWYLRLASYFGQGLRVVLGRNRHPDDLAAGRGELSDLLQGGVDVSGQRCRHGLHGHRC